MASVDVQNLLHRRLTFGSILLMFYGVQTILVWTDSFVGVPVL